ncbi:exonuclease domain-containing protein [Laribacter hongkongensis]|uniref:exonuclease domain-containing protein n=1 Tax=Laribacter hongkongensis TaxID=168471 RepID=UPI001EFD2A04|nr:exonuclease domain-containing protein [Laribacter hongkongensis]MCG9098247.1 ethanolamine utilization protein [Laribacter hongkongensis]
MFDRPYVIVDLETTGGHITRDRITEIGLVEVSHGVTTRWSQLVNPGQPIPPFIEEMTGISDAMVAEAPPFAELAPALLARLNGKLLIAHNARFDYGFLKNEFRRLGLTFTTDPLCTVKLSRRLYPQHAKHSLDSLIARHGIDVPPGMRHRALGDAEAVYVFLQTAVAELGQDAVRAAAADLLAAVELPEGVGAGLVDHLPDVPGVFRLMAADGTVLHVGKAANLRASVLRYFQPRVRNQKEARLAARVASVVWDETLGEFGAALREVRILGQLPAPLAGGKGRADETALSWRLVADEQGYLGPVPVPLAEALDGHAGRCFGVFRNPREAQRLLATFADSYKLCCKRLGLEQSRSGRPCSAHSLGRCRGACLGRESAAQFNTRLESVLARHALPSWPFDDALAVVEQDVVTGRCERHLFADWRYLGSFTADGEWLEAGDAVNVDLFKLLQAIIRQPPASLQLDPCPLAVVPELGRGPTQGKVTTSMTGFDRREQ